MSQFEKKNEDNTILEAGKEKLGEAYDAAKDKASYLSGQASDKASETFYAGKQEVREVGQDIKEKFQSDKLKDLPE